MLWISRSMSRDRSALREQAGRAICVPLRGSCPGPGCSGFWRLAEPSLALVRDGVACLCVNVQQWDIPAASFHFHSAYHVTAIPSPRNTYATHSPWATHDDRHHRRDPWFSVDFSSTNTARDKNQGCCRRIAIAITITTHHGRLERPQTEQQRQAGAPRRSSRRQGRSPPFPRPAAPRLHPG